MTGPCLAIESQEVKSELPIGSFINMWAQCLYSKGKRTLGICRKVKDNMVLCKTTGQTQQVESKELGIPKDMLIGLK